MKKMIVSVLIGAAVAGGFFAINGMAGHKHDHAVEGMRCTFCKGTGFNGNFNCSLCNGTGRNNAY